ncbi:MAG: cyclophilin family peptidyl-prolyl cis-trans isomerase, partial [Myxococcota bacterium]
FGKITDGLDVVATIGSTRTAAGDRPVTPIRVNSIKVVS